MRIFLFLLCTLLATHAHAAPVIHISEDNYEIYGSNAEELRDLIKSKGPIENGDRYDAFTQRHVQWKYQAESDGKTCKLTDIKVTADIIYHLPNWKNKAEANTNLQHTWENYYSHLHAHEDGHAENGKAAAFEIDAMLHQLPSMNNCNELFKVANTNAQNIIQKYDQKDKDYDNKTQHGKTQNVNFP